MPVTQRTHIRTNPTPQVVSRMKREEEGHYQGTAVKGAIELINSEAKGSKYHHL